MAAERMRKVELQSPDDLRFLIDNMMKAAREKIDLHLPPGASDDPLRNRVEAMVMEYVRRTFEIARHSISINGMDVGPIEDYMKKEEVEEFEPYDRKLHDRVSNLYSQVESETIKVTQLRREMPAKAAQTHSEQLQWELENDGRILEEWSKAKLPETAGDLGIKELERQGEVEQNFFEAFETLKSMEKVAGAKAEFAGHRA
ncbi:hypothetical protein RUND412_008172 [Rhizina undulata]